MENQERRAWELRKPSFASLLATGDPPWLPGLERWGVKGSAEIAVSISRGYGLRDIVVYFFLLSFIICLCILFLTVSRVRRNGSKGPSPHCLVIRVLVNINDWTYDTKGAVFVIDSPKAQAKKEKEKRKFWNNQQ